MRLSITAAAVCSCCALLAWQLSCAAAMNVSECDSWSVATAARTLVHRCESHKTAATEFAGGRAFFAVCTTGAPALRSLSMVQNLTGDTSLTSMVSINAPYSAVTGGAHVLTVDAPAQVDTGQVNRIRTLLGDGDDVTKWLQCCGLLSRPPDASGVPLERASPAFFVLAVRFARSMDKAIVSRVRPPPVSITIRGHSFQCTETANGTQQQQAADLVVSADVSRLKVENEHIEGPVTLFAAVSGALSAAVGSSMVVSQLARSVPLAALNRCQFDPSGPMSVWKTPIRWPLGPAVGQYFRGCIVAHAAILLGIALLHFLAGCALYFVTRSSSSRWRKRLKAALATVRFPGLLTLPVLTLLQGIVAAATAVGIHGESSFDLMLMLICAVAVVGIVVVVYTAVFGSFDAAFHEATQEYADAHPLVIFAFGTGKWRDCRRRNFLRHFGLWFRGYRPGAQNFVIFDLGCLVAAAAIDGIVPPDRTSCGYAAAGLLGVSLVSLLAVGLQRPFTAPLSTGLAVIIAALGAFAAAMSAVALSGDTIERSIALTRASNMVVSAVVALCTVRALLDAASVQVLRRMPVEAEPLATVEGSTVKERRESEKKREGRPVDMKSVSFSASNRVGPHKGGGGGNSAPAVVENGSIPSTATLLCPSFPSAWDGTPQACDEGQAPRSPRASPVAPTAAGANGGAARDIDGDAADAMLNAVLGEGAQAPGALLEPAVGEDIDAAALDECLQLVEGTKGSSKRRHHHLCDERHSSPPISTSIAATVGMTSSPSNGSRSSSVHGSFAGPGSANSRKPPRRVTFSGAPLL